MSDILDNAVDSLEVGIRFYLDEELPTSMKHAILNIFHISGVATAEGCQPMAAFGFKSR